MDIIEVNAESHYEAGKQIGVKTKELQQLFYAKFIPECSWDILVKQAASYLIETEKLFPHFVSELRGLALGIGVPFERVWALQCRDEVLGQLQNGKCSSVFIHTEEGWIVGHNEDDFWNGFSKEEARSLYFMVNKSIAGKSIFYLGFPFMIGGETVSINSSGTVQTINTLHHKDIQAGGVPRNIIARALCEMGSVDTIRDTLAKTKRASGYCHTFLIDNKLSCVESTETAFEFITPSDRFVHTNHYLGSLAAFEEKEDEGHFVTVERCDAIQHKIGTVKTGDELKQILHTQTNSESSIYRDGDFSRTMASVIIEVATGTVYVSNRNKGDESDWEKIIPFPKAP